MRFALTQKAITFALAAVAAVPLLVSGEIGFLFVVALPVLGAGGWMLEPPLTREIRFRRGVTIVVIALLAVQIARFTTGEPLAKMGMEFAIAILGIKLASRGFARDYSQIVILSFLLIIAATIAMNELAYGVSFLAFVALSPPVLALAYLRREMESRFGEGPRHESAEMLERLLRSKRVVSPGFLIGSAFLSLPVLLMSTVLFVIFPRVGFGFLGKTPTSRSTVGFGDEMELGDFDIVRLDQTVLLRLEPLNFDGEKAPFLPIKIRGGVYDRYEKNIWHQGAKGRWTALEGQGSDFSLSGDFVNKDRARGFEVLLESMEPPLLFVPDGTGMISTDQVSSGGRPRARLLKRNPLGAIRYRDAAKIGIRYRVYLNGSDPFGDRPGKQHRYLELPEGTERMAALAVELAGQGDTRTRVNRLLGRLQRDYSYSTRLSRSEANRLADTPLDRFLFTRKTGTCEHFATALTLMLRVIDVPSRMATGFANAEWNPIGDYYVVRQSSAHSWTEAFIDDRWVTLDATPPSESGLLASRSSAMAMLLDTLRMRWSKYIVGYTAATQFEIGMSAWRLWIATFRTKTVKPDLPVWPVWIGLGVAALAGIAFWVRRWRRSAGTGAGRRLKRSAIAATRLLVELERRLARQGQPRPRNRTPNEHVHLLAAEGHPLAGVALKVVERYNEVRFGGRLFVAGEIDQLRSLIRGS